VGGCGTGALAKTILGLRLPTRGAIVFDGRTVQSQENLRGFHSRVGYVQQDPYGALAPFMNVQRILEEPLVINGMADRDARVRRIRGVLEEVKLTPVDDFLPRYPHMLSGGQQQRLVVARAAILEPQLSIPDAPVRMLAASFRVDILPVLRCL